MKDVEKNGKYRKIEYIYIKNRVTPSIPMATGWEAVIAFFFELVRIAAPPVMRREFGFRFTPNSSWLVLSYARCPPHNVT